MISTGKASRDEFQRKFIALDALYRLDDPAGAVRPNSFSARHEPSHVTACLDDYVENAMQKKTVETARCVIKAVGFSLMLWIPLLGPLGHYAGFPWLSPAVIFVAVPLLDLVIGEDRTNDGDAVHQIWQTYHYLVPHAYLLIWLVSLSWTATLVQGAEVTFGDRAALLVGAGIASAFATCAAHELLHRPASMDQWAARLTMAMCCYGHFVVEHLHHHATAGRVSQGTVPFAGETMYAFIVRNAVFGFGNSHRIAEAARRRRGLGLLRNKAVQQHLLSAALACGWFSAFGAVGLVVFVTQALIAIATVEMVQYFEHYGLVRGKGGAALEAGGYAWNSNGWLTNAITLNITRHSHHHLDARVPYEGLKMLRNAPTMPAGYFGLTWLGLLPPLWRRIVDVRFLSVLCACDTACKRGCDEQ